ncbi:MAG TPA: hypothetical protein VF302_11215, partial [Candidatus Limnocylindrales bacterium]
MVSRATVMTVVATVIASLLLSVPAGPQGAAAAKGTANAAGGPIYLDPSYSFEERAADLVARLTPTQR